MKKIVGITRYVQDRANSLRDKYPNERIGVILEAGGLTYEVAKAMENDYRARGYQVHPSDPPSPRVPGQVYFVYTGLAVLTYSEVYINFLQYF